MAEPLTVKGRILAVVLGLVLTAGLVEGILRLAGFGYPAWEERDPDLGIIGAPGAAGWWTREGRGYVRYNTEGLRDIERARDKPQGAYRILVLGDSMVQAREVEREDTFVVRLENLLGRCAAPGRRIEVLNFGYGAYNTAAELQLLRKKGWAYRPDMVVLALYVGNDIDGNSRRLNLRFAAAQGYGIPYFRFADDAVALDLSFRDDPLFVAKLQSPAHRLARRMLNASAAAQLLYYVETEVIPAWRAPAAEAEDETRVMGGVHAPVLYPPADEAWDEAWRLTEAGIALMRREVEANGARFRLAIIAMPDQVSAPPDALVPDYPQRRLADFAARAGLAAIDLHAPFRADFLSRGVHLYGFGARSRGIGHLNPEGHRVAAQVLAQRLCPDLGVSPKS